MADAPSPEVRHQQHDLGEAAAARWIADLRLPHGQRVLEVGPGTGSITAALLAHGAQVQAVEIDPERCAHLRQRFAAAIQAGALEVRHADALRAPLPRPPWRVVANPPFQHTAALLRRWLLEPAALPTGIDLLLQREAALKLCGAADAHSRSSILLHAAGVPRLGPTLPRSAVTPPSRVDLALMTWRAHAPPLPHAQLRALDALLAIAFAGPHTMAQALRGVATGTQLRRQAQEQGWDPQAHPRTLTPAAFVALARLLGMTGQLERRRGRR